jgi:hypothetical protein
LNGVENAVFFELPVASDFSRVLTQEKPMKPTAILTIHRCQKRAIREGSK